MTTCMSSVCDFHVQDSALRFSWSKCNSVFSAVVSALRFSRQEVRRAKLTPNLNLKEAIEVYKV